MTAVVVVQWFSVVETVVIMTYQLLFAFDKPAGLIPESFQPLHPSIYIWWDLSSRERMAERGGLPPGWGVCRPPLSGPCAVADGVRYQVSKGGGVD